LTKLRQTQENVSELKVALGAKETELRQKEELANDKLQQMVGDQNKAKKGKPRSRKQPWRLKSEAKELPCRQKKPKLNSIKLNQHWRL
jgi:dynein heavy chain 1